MMQRVGGGLFAGMMLAVAVSCGGTEAPTSNAGAPNTAAMAGMPASTTPTMPKAGMEASGGAKAAAGSTGMMMGGVSSAAGSNAAAGSGGAPASAAAGMTGSAGMSAAAAGKTGSAGMTGATAGGGAATGGCGSESFKAIYDSVFKNATNNCTGPVCHGREPAMAMPVGNLSMSTAAVAYMQLVKASSNSMACMGKTRVVPGDAAGSLLVQKLRGATTMCGGVMPVGAEEIPEADLKRITDWIAGGACDN